MWKKSKIFCLVIALILVVSTVISGCGTAKTDSTEATIADDATADAATTADPAAEETTAAPLEPVKLSWVGLGDPAKDFDTVLAELNKKTQADINATVEFTWIGWGELSEKYPLMLVAGQDIDMIYSCGWQGFADYAKKGAFAELTNDMLAQYAPNALKKLEKKAWDNASIDGKILAIPRNFLEYQDSGVGVRGDYMKKAGLTTINNIDDVMAYCKVAKEADPKVTPFAYAKGDYPMYSFELRQNGLISLPGIQTNLFYFNPLDEKPVLSTPWSNEKIVPTYDKVREMFKLGYIGRNALNNKIMSRDSFRDGLSAMGTFGDNQFRDIFNTVLSNNPAADPQFYSWSPEGPFYQVTYDSGMISIPAASKNKERALMLMDKFFESPEYYMLLIYGIEGTHWEYNADKSKIQVPAGKDATLYPGWHHPWGFGDWAGFDKPSVTEYPGYSAGIKHIREVAVPNPYSGFVPDVEAIKNELAAVFAVAETYSTVLNSGSLEPKDALNKVNEEMKAAGIEKLQAELQRQLDAYTPVK